MQETLGRYYIPEKIRLITKRYARFTVDNYYTTRWQRIEKGIPAGCTISVILFAATMNNYADGSS
jgi:hypothetical protein